jgi:hypothetical protein
MEIKTSIQSEIATIQVFNYGRLNSKTKGGNNKVTENDIDKWMAKVKGMEQG